MEKKNINPNPTLSVITPTYNESDNINSLFKRMNMTLNSMEITWEWLIIDDHSGDDTFSKIKALASNYPNVRGVRLSSNSGTHKASFCGLERSRGECSVILASDLQDPPELIPELFKEWQKGAQIVWAARKSREGESFFKKSASKAYYSLMNHLVGIASASPLGADFSLGQKSPKSIEPVWRDSCEHFNTDFKIRF